MKKLHTIDFGQLVVEIYADPTAARYVFRGDIEEGLDPQKLPNLMRRETVFDLEGISSVNSCGVRTWAQIIREFSSKTELMLERCSVSIVDQFNLVPQTLGAAHVRSFYAPYYCAHCDEEVTVLLDTVSHWHELSQGTAPEIRHSCGTNLEFDALEDSYFIQIENFSKKLAG
jgi:hypothetical protein